MSDIFISYAREDRPHAEALARALAAICVRHDNWLGAGCRIITRPLSRAFRQTPGGRESNGSSPHVRPASQS
jgi:hypothetical protein